MTRKKKPALLIVDDEKNTRDGLERALRRSYEIFLAEDGDVALAILANQAIDVVLSDIRMPNLDGMTLLKRILARQPQPAVILLTAYGSVDQAVEAMKFGAEDFLTKPVNLDHLEIAIRKAIKSRQAEQTISRLQKRVDHKFGLDNIIGNSPAMEEVFETVRQVAPSRATVLIQGESGTGKELIAQALHQLSPRTANPFVAVHCAALPDTLIESELFGHEKGAFTDAHERKVGRFESADAGTLFLDEIGEIDSATQVKILRALEERQIERVGGKGPIDIDVRLVAATNRDLRRMMEGGDFREDLFFRLNVVRIDLPPLRDRPGDIPLLVQHFLQIYAQENGKPIEGISGEAMEAMSKYSWPGNVRELRNMVERMVVLARSNRLGLRDVPRELKEEPVAGPRLSQRAVSMEDAKKQMVIDALEACGGNRTKAAERLGISRRTLHRKLNQYGIH